MNRMIYRKYIWGCMGVMMLAGMLVSCDGRTPLDRAPGHWDDIYKVRAKKESHGFTVRKVSSINGKNSICLKVPNWAGWVIAKKEGWAVIEFNKINKLNKEFSNYYRNRRYGSFHYRISIKVFNSKKGHDMSVYNMKHERDAFSHDGFIISPGGVSPNGRFGLWAFMVDRDRPYTLGFSIMWGVETESSVRRKAKMAVVVFKKLITPCEVK